MTLNSLTRILLVEDDPDIQVIEIMALENLGGFKVEACDSGPDALNKAPAFKPDMILLDMMMPGMDGLETLQRLRRLPETATVPVIFLTARVQPHEEVEYERAGAAAVVRKPFDPLVLADRLRSIWEGCHA